MILSFEGFHLLDVIYVVVDGVECWDSFGWYFISKIFFNLHHDFNVVKGVKAVVGQ